MSLVSFKIVCIFQEYLMNCASNGDEHTFCFVLFCFVLLHITLVLMNDFLCSSLYAQVDMICNVSQYTAHKSTNYV
jgi:hypothetical protein